ncbi:MAG TPA: DUF58 domain-containing protein [Anaerolineae bacterium]|nr:DUF58 domain-containing protein [Anaerolineae bacterium]
MRAIRIPIAKGRPEMTVVLNTAWPVVLTAVLAVVQLVMPSRVWIALLWLMGGLSGLAYVWAREMALHVTARRALRYGWMQVGDRLEERFEVGNASWLPLLWAEVDDASDLPGYRIGRVASCGPHGVVRWTTEQVCTRRGLYTLGPWLLRISDPFGFTSITLRHGEQEAILVHSPVVALPEIELPRGLRAGSSRARRHSREATIDASHTRTYRPDDPLRTIHWPSSAHRGTLIVREAEDTVSGDLWIVLDLERSVQVGEEEESTEEYGVILAASLADRTLRQDRAVGLVAYGATLAYLPPGRGKAQRWRILQALAAAKAGGARSLAEVLSQLRPSLGRGSTVLVITPSLSTAWVDALLPLTRSSAMPAAVLLDAASFEAAPSPAGREGEADNLRLLLARAGVPAHVIRQGYPFRAQDTHIPRGYWTFKTTPMGRAIVVQRPEEA